VYYAPFDLLLRGGEERGSIFGEEKNEGKGDVFK